MKKLILSSVFVLSLCTVLVAQEKKTVTNTPAAAAQSSNADIKFEKTTYDYGTIKWDSNGDCEFKFTNTGTEPLVLSACQGSCQCTVPTCPKEPILPGKSGTIKVHYNTKNQGPINKQVTITSNAKSGTQVLKIVGTVEAKPVDEPFPTEKKANNGIPLEKGN